MTVLEECSICGKIKPCHPIFIDLLEGARVDDLIGEMMCRKCMDAEIAKHEKEKEKNKK